MTPVWLYLQEHDGVKRRDVLLSVWEDSARASGLGALPLDCLDKISKYLEIFEWKLCAIGGNQVTYTPERRARWSRVSSLSYADRNHGLLLWIDGMRASSKFTECADSRSFLHVKDPFVRETTYRVRDLLTVNYNEETTDDARYTPFNNDFMSNIHALRQEPTVNNLKITLQFYP